MNKRADFSREVLSVDAASVVDRIAAAIHVGVLKDLKRKGVVLGLSGGIDSSVVAALSVLALGKERVLALLMPERESSDESTRLGQLVADHLGIETVLEDITPMLEASDCYRRRDEAIREVIPEYGPDFKCKLVLPSLSEEATYRLFSIVAEASDGTRVTARLTPRSYQGVVAATNFKQRIRKLLEYYHADRLNYAVAGTPNRLEYDQGFFVKNGDGAADLKPIAHLYKTQVYQVAKYLRIPDEVRQRPPTTDTYSLSQSQEEFYFSVPYDQMDLCLYGMNHGIASSEVAHAAGLTPNKVEQLYRDITAKRKATRYQHLRPLLVEPIGEVEH